MKPPVLTGDVVKDRMVMTKWIAKMFAIPLRLLISPDPRPLAINGREYNRRRRNR